MVICKTRARRMGRGEKQKVDADVDVLAVA